jgi:hypothetical protein
VGVASSAAPNGSSNFGLMNVAVAAGLGGGALMVDTGAKLQATTLLIRCILNVLDLQTTDIQVRL